jgi:hypothetical protein
MLSVWFTCKMLSKRTIIEIWQNKRAVYCYFRCLPILFSTFSCLEAFLHIFDTCEFKFNIKSKFTPNSFTSSPQEISIFFNLKLIFYWWVFFPFAIAWNFSGLAFIWLFENQSIKVKLSFSSVLTESVIQVLE